jgi:CheY-like chemotaxis protein
MKILILEDSEERIYKFRQKLGGHSVKITKDTKECIELLKNDGPFQYIMLDHDLSVVFEKPGEGTGYEVAKFIAENPDLAPRHILIHTMNNIGAAAMMNVLGDAEIKASYIPLLWEKLQIKENI